MKSFIKMSKKETLYFCLMAFLSGIMIGLAGTASLLSNIYISSLGKIIGAILFSFGIYVIVVFEMKLFTGMISDIPELGLKNSWQLAVCFLCNTIGVLFVGLLVSNSHLSIIGDLGASIIECKLSSDTWYLSAFCSSILCGVLITLSVKSRLFAAQKGLSATLGVIFPIVVFAFCGFDHSVANNLYLFFLGEFSLKVVAYVLITIIGNIFGGVLIPVVLKLKNKQD